MAQNVKTRSKRASAIQIAKPFAVTAPYPDGSVSVEDRQLLVFAYTEWVLGITHEIDFEEGDFSDVDTTTQPTKLAVSVAAALAGSDYGLAITQDSSLLNAFVTINISPEFSNVLTVRWYWDPNDLAISNDLDNFGSVQLNCDESVGAISYIWYHRIQRNSGVIQYKFIAKDDANGSHDMLAYTAIPSQPVCFEVKVVRASSAVASDGTSQLWIDGTPQTAVTGLDNWDLFTSVIGLDLGVTYGTDSGTTSVMYYDEVVISNDGVYIGPIETSDDLTINDMTLAEALLDTPALGQIHILSNSDTTLAGVLLDTPSVGQVHSLSVSDTVLAGALLDTPVLEYEHIADYEEGDFSDADAYSANVAINGTAALRGSYGVQHTVIAGSNPMWTRHVCYPQSGVIRIRMYFDANGTTFAEASGYTGLSIRDNSDASIFGFSFFQTSGSFRIQGFWRDDDLTLNYTSSTYPNQSIPHYIEFLAIRESAEGAADGVFSWWVDGSLVVTISNCDNITIFDTASRIYEGALTVNTGVSGTLYTDELVYRNYNQLIGPAPDELTVSDLTLAEVILDNPAFSQVHVLGISDTTLASALLDTPSIGQTHILSVADTTLAECLLDTPVLSSEASLTVNDMTLAQVSLDTPALGAAEDNLTVNDMTLSAVTLDTPALGQVHILSVSDFTLASALLDTPTLGQIHALSISDITLAGALLDTPAIGQTHILSVNDFSLSEIVLDTPTLSSEANLTASDFTLLGAILDTPALGQEHTLSINDFTLAGTLLDTPVLGTEGIDALTINDMTLAGAVLDTPALGQIHDLSITDFTLAQAALDTPTLTSIANLTVGDMTLAGSLLDTPAISQTHVLGISDFTLNSSILDTPALGQTHILSTNDFTLNSAQLDTPSLSGSIELTVNDFTLAQVVLDTPVVSVTHNLSANDFYTAPTIMDNPAIGQTHILSIGDFALSAIVLDTPALGGIQDLSVNDFTLAGAILDAPPLEPKLAHGLLSIVIDTDEYTLTIQKEKIYSIRDIQQEKIYEVEAEPWQQP